MVLDGKPKGSIAASPNAGGAATVTSALFAAGETKVGQVLKEAAPPEETAATDRNADAASNDRVVYGSDEYWELVEGKSPPTSGVASSIKFFFHTWLPGAVWYYLIIPLLLLSSVLVASLSGSKNKRRAANTGGEKIDGCDSDGMPGRGYRTN